MWFMARRIGAGATETPVSWSGDNLVSPLKSPFRGLFLGRNLDKGPGWDASPTRTPGYHSSHGTVFDTADGGTEKLANLASPLEINPVIMAADSLLFVVQPTTEILLH